MSKATTSAAVLSAAARLRRLQECIAAARGERERLAADLATERGRIAAKVATGVFEAMEGEGAGKIRIDRSRLRELEDELADAGETVKSLEAILPGVERETAVDALAEAERELEAINGEAVQACGEFERAWGVLVKAINRVLDLRAQHQAVVIGKAQIPWRLLNLDKATATARGEVHWPPTGLQLDPKHRFAIRFGEVGAFDHFLETRAFTSGDSALQWRPVKRGVFLAPVFRNGGRQGEKGESRDPDGEGPSEP